MKHTFAPLLAFLIALALFASAPLVRAVDQVVTDSGDDGGLNQLRAKLAALRSSGGGTLTFSIGTATIVLTGGVLPNITTNATIDGGNVITLSGNNASPVFVVDGGATLTLNNITVTKGFNGGGDGGAIQNFGTLNINHSKFLENLSSAAFSGGAIVTYGPLNITDSEFGSNKAGNGGAIYPRFAPAVTTITGCNFHDNVTTNATDGWGGAMLLWDGAPVTITNSQIVSNTARHGGGIYVVANSSLTMRDSEVTTNMADNGMAGNNYGGGIFNNGTISLTNVTISGNQVVEAANFMDNRGGGGIANFVGATATVTKGAISNNKGREGGGILNHGQLTITDVAISGNRGGEGGAILNNPGAGGVLTITGSTLSGNVISFAEFHVTTPRGAAILNSMGTIQLTNTTISGNAGDTAFRESDGNVTLVNVTIANNSNGGIGSDHSPNVSVVSVKNTLVAGNGSYNCGPILFNAFTGQFSMASDSTCTWSGTNNQVVPDPKLGPLANNGGLTQTHLPQADSPAKDGGTGAGAPARDQRGYLRAGAAPDIGAVEVGGIIPVTLANISTRLRVETGDNALIGGFIITGGGAKRVLLRGIGPSLNVAGHLDDPVLELYDSTGQIIASNDNWMDAPNKQAIIDTTIPPSNDLESAILMDLNPGNYTAIVRGVGNTAGVGLVEAYDLDRTAGSKLANISTRGLVQMGDNVMIGGFIVLGPDSQRVIVRAIGPSLPLAGKLADPTLELRNGNGGILAANDNWRSDHEAEIIATTIPPSNDLESAIVRDLAPGNYTAIVSGVNNTTGVALVEVYALQ